MESSLYNISKEIKDNLVLYNTLSGAVIILDKENKEKYINKNFETMMEYNQLVEMGFIVKSHEQELELIDQIKNDFHYKNKTLVLTLLPSTLCNMRCVYCFESIRNLTMSNNIINQLIVFLKKYLIDGKYDHLSVIWFGGEPLLKIEIVELLNEELKTIAKDLGLYIENTIITNGTLLNDRTVNCIKKLDNLKYIQITIDGLGDIHNERRPLVGKDSFDEIIKNIKKYITVLPFEIRVNVDKLNILEIEKLIKFLSEQENFKENLYIYFAKVEGDRDSCYTSKEFGEKVMKCYHLLKKYNFIQSLNSVIPLFKPLQCAALSKHHLVVDSDGSLYTCWEVVGNNNYKVGDIFVGLKTPRACIKETENTECRKCKVFPICRTGCPLHYKNNNIKDNCLFNPELLLDYIVEVLHEEN